ncbi:MAG: response regulator transcription factor, partial [Gemmatimonadales bacterium]
TRPGARRHLASLRAGHPAEYGLMVRIHLGLDDPALRRRLAEALRSDPDVVIVADAEHADLVLEERAPAVLANGAAAVDEGTALTPRELAVLHLVALGLGNKEIAEELMISRHTAKYHVASVLAKLGVHSRTEAVTLGVRRGMVPL